MIPVSVLLPLAVLLVLVALGLWVYADAKSHQEQGVPIVFDSPILTLDTPFSWALSCIVLSVLVLPLYLALRQGS